MYNPEIIPPNPWEWTSSEYNAFAHHGRIKNITWKRWNAFIDWINSIIDYINKSENKNYALISNLDKMRCDKNLYADSWNNINYYARVAAGESCSDVKKGDKLYGYYFIELTNIMNNLL